MITLYHGGANAKSLRLLIALEELSLAYECHEVSLSKLEQWSSPYLQLSPEAAVPLLIEGALRMDDSAIALLYLAEANPSSGLLPMDPAARYEAQAAIDTVDALLLESINLLGWQASTSERERSDYLTALANVSARARPAGWSAVWRDAEADLGSRAREKVVDALGFIEAALGEGAWLTGRTFGVADISAFAAARAAPVLLDQPSIGNRFPRFFAWSEQIAARAAVRRALERAARAECPFEPAI
jgi:glutathione S-transferase